LHGDQIASLCGFCALAHGEAELEVGTVPAYRGKGLATLACAAFLEHARRGPSTQCTPAIVTTSHRSL
ncbi:MAG: GNAT family N-acetyltransferase, partial [Anaerolineaceae bacterium]|nr:GNAT family N-acetyltransferase [Anaerolineaceae bacterium]